MKYFHKVGVGSLAALMVITSSSQAVFQSGLGVTESHKPNRYTLECLENLSQACSVSAAIQTVLDEELGLERAKVLVGVARSQIALGNDRDGLKTLVLAMEEARSAKLNLVTQEKIRTVAPLFARAGDTASALALAEEVTIPGVRDRIYEDIAAAAITRGDLADARVALGYVSKAERVFWRSLDLFLQTPTESLVSVDMTSVRDAVGALTRIDQKYRGLVTLAFLEKKLGNEEAAAVLFVEADELFERVTSSSLKSDLLSLKLRAIHETGTNGTMFTETYEAAQEASLRLPQTGKAQFASRIGPIEAQTGNLASALARVEHFADVAEKAAYLASLEAGSPDARLSAAIDALADELQATDSAYERDRLRLLLLEAAIGAKDLSKARDIVASVEDDDNQALGLALLTPLLS